MASRESKRKQPMREVKQMRERKRIENRVFDPETMLTLGWFLNNGILKSIDFPVATGKEANVYRATAGEGQHTAHFAVKIFKIETSSFLHMCEYINGDPRFKKVRHIKKSIIYAWTRKEFRNLQVCEESGVRVPHPCYSKNNVLIMDFLGVEGIPDSTLHQLGSEDPKKDCETLLGYIKKLYARGFVHGDLSEYNIIMHEGDPYLIDLGQCVSLAHPKAHSFVERDVQNVLAYFERSGVYKDEEEVLKWVR
ncbi:MAG: serine protein kinase RIO, partial [Candidatus Micrarchaeota archaeon]